ncbi:MAG TPA: GrpB family protein [Casimicrobiaceae bacterium]|nr:GrpB family protein [Casimicrobiaceae bacterium]
MSQILSYAILSPAYVEYDYAAPAAAQRVIALIEAASPWVKAEHIGSTAIPGCAGKGIVDLVALYPRGRLEETRRAIDHLGFQHQRAGHEFPEERPMRVGAIEYEGAIYRLHVHIVAAESAEAKALYRFRDVLRMDAKLRDAYQARKRAILQSGTSDPAGYTHAKGEFINAVIVSNAPP